MTDSWQKRTPGTWMLYQFVAPGSNGQCEDIGEFPTYRAAVEAARNIAKISKLEGDFSSSFCRSHKREGAQVDGYTQRISLEGPKDYDPDIELRIRDGRVMWLSDFEDEARAAHVKVAALEQSLESVAEGAMGSSHQYDGPPSPHGLYIEAGTDGKLHISCDDCPFWREVTTSRLTRDDFEAIQAEHHPR